MARRFGTRKIIFVPGKVLLFEEQNPSAALNPDSSGLKTRLQSQLQQKLQEYLEVEQAGGVIPGSPSAEEAPQDNAPSTHKGKPVTSRKLPPGQAIARALDALNKAKPFEKSQPTVRTVRKKDSESRMVVHQFLLDNITVREFTSAFFEVLALFQNGNRFELTTASGVLRMVMPDFFSAGAQGSHWPVGGPGSDPIVLNMGNVPSTLLPQTTHQTVDQITSAIPASPAAPQPVDVFILDSVPPASVIDQWRQALEANAAAQTGTFTHPLLALCGSQNGSTQASASPFTITSWDQGRFKVSHRTPALTEFDDILNPTFVYSIQDHGLFIAGLVRALGTAAPAADVNIHVIETMNQYAVGSLSTMITSLDYVESLMSPERQTLINCSFVLALPGDGHCDTDELGSFWSLVTLNGTEFNIFVSEIINEIQGNAVPYDPADTPNLRVIAASGNDSDFEVNEFHYQPRFPAAANSVVGVGAVDEADVLAPFSNISGDPGEFKLYTFGGMMSNGSTGGLYGIYTGSDLFNPDGTPAVNTDGLAYWAGTSFATGVFTGVTARLASVCNISVAQVIEYIKNNSTPVASDTTGQSFAM